MQNLTTEIFDKGIYNFVTDETVPQSASIDALGWVSTDDIIETVKGRQLFGVEGGDQMWFQIQKGSTAPVSQSDIVSSNVKIAQSFQTNSFSFTWCVIEKNCRHWNIYWDRYR